VSISLRSRIRQACLLGCVSGAALLVPAVGQASAATYPGAGSSFTGGAEGWKAASKCQLLNVLEVPLLCTANGAYDGTAGAPAGSFAASTNIPLNLIGSFKSEVVAESPTFTAVEGGAGQLSLSRAFAPGGLISLTPQYLYTANLVDVTAKSSQKVITETLEGEVPFATKTGILTLTKGHEYKVEIDAKTSSSVASIGVLAGEAIGRFDNVVVTGPDLAKEEEKTKEGEKGEPGTPGEKGSEGSGGSNGSNGSNGTTGTSGTNGTNGTSGTNGTNGGGAEEGAGGVSAARLESMVQSSLIGPATLHGTKLSVKAKCPAKAGAACTISLQGMLSRKKPATAGRKAKVKLAKTKNFALTVKPPARAKVKTKTKLMFKETIKVGASKVTVYKTLPLIRK
jgi:hypothetical protein